MLNESTNHSVTNGTILHSTLCENVSGKTLLESSVRSSYGGIVKIISTCGTSILATSVILVIGL